MKMSLKNPIHDEILDKFSRGFTLQEIAENIEDLSKLTITPKQYNRHTCDECGTDLIHIDNGVTTCKRCGVTDYELIPPYIDEIWKRKRTTHSRKRWFLNKVNEYVDRRYVSILTDDFVKVVNAMESLELIKGRNVSKYTYYIIRLCSRRDIPLIKQAKDVKTAEIRNKFDDVLFGQVYRTLGLELYVPLLSGVA